MSISTPFIRRPIATSLLMVGILLVGLVAFRMLPIAPLPQVDFPTVTVTAQLPGASPETMASSVATPLETQFAQISSVTQMTSTSGLGVTSITIQFDLSRNIDAAAQDIQAAINAAGGQLPKNLPSPPTYRKVNPADAPILNLAVTSDVLPITVVDDYAENIIAQQLSQLPGVAQVSIFGQQKPAVRVQVDPVKLAALGLSLEDVRSVLMIATDNSPKGSFDGARQSFNIYDNDQLLKAKQYDDVIVAYRNGSPVRIRDIGRAVDGAENTKLAAWENSKRAIGLAVFRQPGANIIDTAQAVKNALPRLEAAIPPSIHVGIAIDRTQTIQRLGRRRRVHDDADHRPGGDGDLPLPAQLLGDRHPQRHRADGAGGHLCRHVRARLQPRQPVADGAYHRRRLRRRRRHRDDREHRPPHRGGPQPDGGGLSKAPARSASRSSPSASPSSRCSFHCC